DAGFARHDVPAGGAKDAQVHPRFKGPIPKRFPFSDDDIRARKVTVGQILATYREAYSPAEGSPLIGAGDPADGAGSYLGAVAAGKPPPHARSGRGVAQSTRRGSAGHAPIARLSLMARLGPRE